MSRDEVGWWGMGWTGGMIQLFGMLNSLVVSQCLCVCVCAGVQAQLSEIPKCLALEHIYMGYRQTETCLLSKADVRGQLFVRYMYRKACHWDRGSYMGYR